MSETCNCALHGEHGGVAESMDEMEFARSIHGASARGDLPRVLRLLAADPALATQYDAYGYLALHYAARLNRRDIASALLDAAAATAKSSTASCLVTAPTATPAKTTALHRAVMARSPEMLAMLLSRANDGGVVDGVRDGDGKSVRECIDAVQSAADRDALRHVLHPKK
ncbi:hypothetical protein BC828DRAFT_380438 [Blastocladiella britannica]|nr:hypothetical protein BC828DRAFT_380438 [Blastocladiella britannica]